MVQNPTLRIIGIIEIFIGCTTLFFNIFAYFFWTNTKTLNVLLFVIITACVSTALGIGLLKENKLAYQLLLYFSSVILLSKFLIFFDILHLNGALETTVPSPVKNGVSVLYHGFLIYFLSRPKIKKIYNTA